MPVGTVLKSGTDRDFNIFLITAITCFLLKTCCTIFTVFYDIDFPLYIYLTNIVGNSCQS